MNEEMLNKRAEMYKNDKSVRICKDTKNRYHACLIPWDDLDKLSTFENKITGKNLDYKQMDRDNINVIFEIMK